VAQPLENTMRLAAPFTISKCRKKGNILVCGFAFFGR